MQDGLKVAVKFFDKKESKKVFGVAKVFNLYQPVYILIDNKSSDTYEFDKRNLSRKYFSTGEVAAECGFNTAARASGYGAAGIFFWPLLIPAAVDGYGSAQANKKMKADYMYKGIENGEILPNQVHNGVVFLGKMESGESLTVKLKDAKTGRTKAFKFNK